MTRLLQKSETAEEKNNYLQDTRELEDDFILFIVEKILRKKRGYVFRKPKPGTPVISLMSGGLDTTVTTAILLEELKLHVYPVYFQRNIGHSKQAYRSVSYLAQFFQKLYKDRFHDLAVLTTSIPPQEIAPYLLKDSMNILVNKHTEQRRGVPFQPSQYAYNAVLYAQYLEEVKRIQIRNIFGGWLTSNAKYLAYETLTAMRTIMLEICIMTRDYSWQFTSLPLEKKLGNYFDKEWLIKWGHVHNIPLEKTWTCEYGFKYQCGLCMNCRKRMEGFAIAKIPDRTIYKINVKDPLKPLKKIVKKLVGIKYADDLI